MYCLSGVRSFALATVIRWCDGPPPLSSHVSRETQSQVGTSQALRRQWQIWKTTNYTRYDQSDALMMGDEEKPHPKCRRSPWPGLSQLLPHGHFAIHHGFQRRIYAPGSRPSPSSFYTADLHCTRGSSFAWLVGSLSASNRAPIIRRWR